jgi:hypothetical protein
MNKTEKVFRFIVLRRSREQDLFEDKSLYRYHAPGAFPLEQHDRAKPVPTSRG